MLALADINRRRLEDWAKGKLGKQYGISEKRLFPDYRDMLALDELDAVIISSPDHWHALHAIHAMEAGKDVYIEKPMTLTIREGRLMVDAARANSRICQVGSQQRSTQENRVGCALVRAGRIGKVHGPHGELSQPVGVHSARGRRARIHQLGHVVRPTPYRGYHEKLYTPAAANRATSGAGSRTGRIPAAK